MIVKSPFTTMAWAHRHASAGHILGGALAWLPSRPLPSWVANAASLSPYWTQLEAAAQAAPGQGVLGLSERLIGKPPDALHRPWSAGESLRIWTTLLPSTENGQIGGARVDNVGPYSILCN